MLKENKFLNKKTITLICASVVIIALLIIAVCTSEVTSTAWALLPPFIAIALALITKEVFSSLFLGILSGAVLAAKWRPADIVNNVVGTGLTAAVSDSAGIFIFLIELGILVCLINKAGGSKAFGEWAQTHVKTKIGAAICTFVLGVLIFIDDYFNCLTVGSVMKPVTDKHKISRSKLAYLIDATAAPVCMIAPISSWAAAVNQYAANPQEGLQLFVAAIPFNFYSLLTFVFVVGLIVMKMDFGPMRKHEINAQNGDLFSGAIVKSEAEVESSKGRVLDLILPIVVLIIFSILALIYVGGFFGENVYYNVAQFEDPAEYVDYTGDLVGAFGNTDAYVGLPWGGLVALIFTFIYLAIRKVVSLSDAMKTLPKGFIAMVPAIFILTFATALKNITNDALNAAGFVESVMAGFPEALSKLLPAVIFLVACVISFATGTSWGTFGILIPIVQSMFPTSPEMMVVGMSACLAGAVCGDHCSPISDTTIMSSAGAECEHLNHVTTQIPYAIYVAVVSFVCFLIAGFVPIWYVALPIAIAIMIGSLIVTKIIVNKKYAGDGYNGNQPAEKTAE